jgi:tellurium resistance protein TerD
LHCCYYSRRWKWKQNFGQVKFIIRIVDDTSNTELLKYELDDFSSKLQLIWKSTTKSGQWNLTIGVGMKGGLEDYLNKYSKLEL